MDTATLARLARDLGGNEVRERNGKVTCSCLLARWTHFGGYDTKPSMVLYPQGRLRGDPIFKCMGCHEEGSVRDIVIDHWSANPARNLIHWIFEIDGDEGADKLIKRSAAIASLPDDPMANRKRKVMEPAVVRKTTDDGRVWYDHKLLVEADAVKEISWGAYNQYHGKVPRFAFQRGLTAETCKEWELGHDPTMKRLLFPIRDRKGRLVGISGRLYSKECVYCGGQVARGQRDEANKRIRDHCRRCGKNEPPKYLHSDDFKRNMVLYGEHRRQDAVDGTVYLVEGHIDMLLLWQLGYRPVVAMLGSYPGHCQIEKLIAYWGRRIIIIPDGDKAGVDMAAKVKALVADRVPVIVKKCPDGSDPGAIVQAHLRGEITLAEVHQIFGEPPVKAAA